jgi:type II restriction enzyme
MPTKRQILGRFGEMCVAKDCRCPKCKRNRTLKRLPNNFKCADVICDFCGYLAQVKAVTVKLKCVVNRSRRESNLAFLSNLT